MSNWYFSIRRFSIAAVLQISLAGGMIVVPVCIAFAVDETEQDDINWSAVSQLMQQQVNSGQVPNALGLIAINGKVEFREAHGMARQGIPATPDTIIRLSSLTKTVTAVAVMMLIEDGVLGLNDPVSKHIPAFAQAKVQVGLTTAGEPLLVKPKTPMTIHHLLTHTAGLAGFSPATDKLYDSRDTKAFAQGIAALPLRHHPGEGYQYGNAYEVLAAVVEVSSGENLAGFLQRRLFNPLQMDDTTFYVPSEKVARYSVLFTRGGAQDFVIEEDLQETPTSFYSGGGGLRSTLNDFYRFTSMLLQGGEYDGVRVLQPESVSLMTRNHVDPSLPGARAGDNGWGYGLSVRYRQQTPMPGSIGTFGWTGGTGTLYFVDPELELIGIVFTQLHWRDQHRLRESFLVGIYQTIQQHLTGSR